MSRLLTLLLLPAALITALLLPACDSSTGGYLRDAQALAQLEKQPLNTTPWNFGQTPGTLISTTHYHIYTTISDNLYQHLLARILEAAHTRAESTNPSAALNNKPLDCYVFASRDQWEAYTRLRGGANAPIYLHIAAGGYCQNGVFAGYDIGRDQTLSVIAHEAWHQYSWFAFKNRLPSWLEEGLATQNEGIDWNGTTPVFRSELNWRRFFALKDALRDNRLWQISDLVKTHAGRVIKLPQKQIDAYYAQLWSLVLFLRANPTYARRLQHLIDDASAGKLVLALKGTSVTQHEIDNFSEHWNTVAGPLYMQKYITPDFAGLQSQYESWARQFTNAWPPRPLPNNPDKAGDGIAGMSVQSVTKPPIK